MEQKKFLEVAKQCADTLEASVGEGKSYILIANDGEHGFCNLFGKGLDIVVGICELLQENKEIRELIEVALEILDERDKEALEEE